MQITKTNLFNPHAMNDLAGARRLKAPPSPDSLLSAKPQGRPEEILAQSESSKIPADLARPGVVTRPQPKPAILTEPAKIGRTPEMVTDNTSPSSVLPQTLVTPAVTIEQIQNNWGTGNPDSDVNGDGTVDINDLVQLITSMPVPPGAQQAPPPAELPDRNSETARPEPLTTISATSSAPLEQNTLTVDGLLKAWSNGPAESARESSPYDLNGDGVVNIDDLVAMITGMTPGSSSTPRSTEMSASDGGQKNHSAAGAQPNPKRTETLVDAMMTRLDSLGFQAQPPTNIRELIGALDLSPSQTNQAIRMAQQRYPQGLGVNMIG